MIILKKLTIRNERTFAVMECIVHEDDYLDEIAYSNDVLSFFRGVDDIYPTVSDISSNISIDLDVDHERAVNNYIDEMVLSDISYEINSIKSNEEIDSLFVLFPSMVNENPGYIELFRDFLRREENLNFILNK